MRNCFHFNFDRGQASFHICTHFHWVENLQLGALALSAIHPDELCGVRPIRRAICKDPEILVAIKVDTYGLAH